MKHPSYRPDIDGLRAVAVALVVVFHAASGRMPGGFIGVDVFFVISGFLISSIIMAGIESGTFGLADFYGRRIRRIFPALTVVLVATVVLGWFLYEPREYAALGKEVAASGVFMSNVLLWKESGYFDTDSALKPLLHLWSLGVEEQFYIGWPLILSLVYAKAKKAWIVVAVIGALSFAINLVQLRSDPVAAFYLPFSRFWELLVGAGLAYVSLNFPAWLPQLTSRRLLGAVKLRDLLSFAGLLLIILGSFRITALDPFPGWLTFLPVGGAAAVIAAGTDAWPNKNILARQAVVYIGLISYPLYLWHWPLLVFSRTTRAFAALPRLTSLVAVALSVGLAIATYHFLERPMRRGYRVKRTGFIVPLSAAMIAVIAVGAVTEIAGGFSGRYPASIRPLLDYKVDYSKEFWNTHCHLVYAPDKFPPGCTSDLERVSPANRMIVWGDSHAAMLVNSLSSIGSRYGIRVAQLTSGHCAPVETFDPRAHQWCVDHSRQTRQLIASLHPGTVVLAAAWMAAAERSSVDDIPETARWLRTVGVQRIILVGPEPDWHKTLPVTIARYMRATNTDSIPSRLRDGLTPGVFEMDAHAAEVAKNAGAVYVSPYSVFCNAQGCMTTLPGPRLTLSAWDNAHLSPEAAAFLVSRDSALFFPDSVRR